MLETISVDAKVDKPWLFKPGQVTNPKGRPKGTKNKIAEKFLDALLNDFEAHGKEAIEAARAESPLGYVKVCASLLPQVVEVKNKTAFDEMDANDLIGLISVITEQSTRLTGLGAGSIIEAQTGIIQTISEAEIIP